MSLYYQLKFLQFGNTCTFRRAAHVCTYKTSKPYDSFHPSIKYYSRLEFSFPSSNIDPQFSPSVPFLLSTFWYHSFSFPLSHIILSLLSLFLFRIFPQSSCFHYFRRHLHQKLLHFYVYCLLFVFNYSFSIIPNHFFLSLFTFSHNREILCVRM